MRAETDTTENPGLPHPATMLEHFTTIMRCIELDDETNKHTSLLRGG